MSLGKVKWFNEDYCSIESKRGTDRLVHISDIHIDDSQTLIVGQTIFYKANKHKEQLRQRIDEYRVLINVTKSLQTNGGMTKMLQGAMKAIVSYGNLKIKYKAGVFLSDEQNNILKLYTSIGDFTDEFLELDSEVPCGESIYGRETVTGQRVIIGLGDRNKYLTTLLNGIEPFEHYIIPLKNRNKLVGVLFLFTDPNPPWFERSQEILLSMGNLIAFAIEQRRIEEEINKKNTALNELMELKNKFLGIASHDLRNPIYLIRAFSEILKDESLGTINKKQRDLLEKIFNSSTYMNTLLENLLDISKIDSGKIELHKTVQDFNETIKEQAGLNQFIANKKEIKLHLELGKIPLFAFDNSAIIQTINNFIGNAIKFSPRNSNIFISIEIKNGKLLFSVRDQGPGLSQGDQKLLFGEFQTLSAKPTGGEKSTGLGLAIVKKLIKLHGGEVGVTSKLGQGSTFSFTVPLHDISPQSN